MSQTLTLVLFLVVIAGVLFVALLLYYIRKVQRKRGDGLYFESQQGPIFYKLHGHKGPYVLLIHGLGASTYCWRHLIPILCRRYKVISFDLWGFGYSSKELQTAMGLDSQIEVIQELLDHLNVRSYSVIGHSMGGELALWLKKIDPRVRKCIAITPAAHPGLVSDWLRSFSWIANWTPLVLSASAIKRVLIRNLEDPSTLTEDMVQGYYEPYLDPKAHLTFAASLNVIRDPRVYNHLGEIDVDLVIWAAHDMVITYKHVKKMMEKLSVEKVITHPWAGHIPMEDDPEWLGKRVMHALET